MLLDRCLCGSDRDVAMFGRNDVTLIECECGLIRLRSVLTPDEYFAQYRGDYHSSRFRHPGCVPYADRYDHDLEVARIRAARYTELLGEFPGGAGRILDVGAANGAFVDAMRDAGYAAEGIDPDPAMARAHIMTGTTEELHGEPFDVVTYHDVLEHVLDPLAELRRAVELVRPGGRLIVDVPDVSVPEGAHHFKPEHPWYFTETTLTDLLGAADCEVTHIDRPVPGKLVAIAEPGA